MSPRSRVQAPHRAFFLVPIIEILIFYGFIITVYLDKMAYTGKTRKSKGGKVRRVSRASRARRASKQTKQTRSRNQNRVQQHGG